MLDSINYSTLVNVGFSLDVLLLKFSLFDKYLLLLVRNHPDQFSVSKAYDRNENGR